MAFNPTIPGNNTPLKSSEIRDQFTALKALIDQHSGVKVYRAHLTQSGTDAPVVVVMTNTLGAALNWTRDGQGLYIGTLASGSFDPDKTFHRIHSSAVIDYAVAVATSRIESGSIIVETVKLGASEDSQLTSTPIEIVIHD